MDWFYLLGIVAVWYALNRWILPKMGIQTWMSGSCELPRAGEKKTDTDSAKIEKEL